MKLLKRQEAAAEARAPLTTTEDASASLADIDRELAELRERQPMLNEELTAKRAQLEDIAGQAAAAVLYGKAVSTEVRRTRVDAAVAVEDLEGALKAAAARIQDLEKARPSLAQAVQAAATVDAIDVLAVPAARLDALLATCAAELTAFVRAHDDAAARVRALLPGTAVLSSRDRLSQAILWRFRGLVEFEALRGYYGTNHDGISVADTVGYSHVRAQLDALVHGDASLERDRPAPPAAAERP